MARIKPIEFDQLEGKSKTLLEGVRQSLGVVPLMMRALAHSPAALEAYAGIGKALGGGVLSPALREQIAVAVAGINNCDYCASAHTLLGKNLGAKEDELRRNLRGESNDPRTLAAISFARAIIEEHGWVSDDDLQRIRAAGFNEGEIVEIFATVAMNLFSTYFNHIAQTDIDFPLVETRNPVTA